ncbi:alpha/beta fold hydrolase [Arcobacter vandammei]|uniref:alpha/beta fold hydrolase n=1 Tax=Arcobacter vandammei TaxID=2782243 RepID=UPI0018DFB844|nr:alpha/beta fold hydrolase [Arcobacter vandammei]
MKEKIYFIPGLMTNEKLWKRVLPKIEDSFEIIYLKIPRSTNFDEINEILSKQIKDEKINLLGFSLGGYIASYFSIKFPQRVKRLFMLSSTPAKTSDVELARRREKLEFAKLNDEISLDLQKAKSLVEEQNIDDLDLLQTIVEMFNEMGKEEFISQLESTFNRVDLSKELKELNLPVTMFYSSDDRLLDSEAINKLENEKHNITLIKRVGTSHNIPLEFPEELEKNIRNWMNN